jgi:hypothetical protein
LQLKKFISLPLREISLDTLIRAISLSFGDRRFQCSILLSAVGVDFLAANKPLVDPFSRLFLDAPSSNNWLAAPSPWLCSLLSPGCSASSVLAASRPSPLQGVKPTVDTSGRTVFAKAVRLDPSKLPAAEKEFHALEAAAAAIIRRPNSPWLSPLNIQSETTEQGRSIYNPVLVKPYQSENCSNSSSKQIFRCHKKIYIFLYTQLLRQHYHTFTGQQDLGLGQRHTESIFQS